MLLADNSPQRTALLRAALEGACYEVVAIPETPHALLRAVDLHRPDIIIIDTDSPSHEMLAHLLTINQEQARPILIFSSDGGSESIRQAVRAGVSAYVVDGLAARRIKGIVEVAVARFDENRKLVDELAQANLKLSERKLVDRAKGILMKSRGISEDEAYHALRRLAMTRTKRIGEIARLVIDMEDLIA